ncbi:MAG: 2-oxo acid dehydrogenase subunit E2 [Myxococcales bacterium]|nr:2-oxo acid dehydrogenase subunit E2 [Myxococcales bacterium]
MREGNIAAWRVKVGDKISPGDILAEIETDKAIMEYESLDAGIVRQLLVAEKEPVMVGAPICILGNATEDLADVSAKIAAMRAALGAAVPTEPATTSTAAPGAVVASAPQPLPQVSAITTGHPATAATAAAVAPTVAHPPRAVGRVGVSPLAARVAAEMGVDLKRVVGTGPDGRVVKRDVVEAANRQITVPMLSAGSVTPAFEDSAPSQMRKVIASRLVESKNSAPHFYLTKDIDMDQAMALREQILASGPKVRISINDMVVRAAALASRKINAVNAAWVDDGGGRPMVRHFSDIHVGVAVALEDGLVTPVVRHADKRSLSDIAVDIRDMAEKAKTRRLDPEHYQGNTLTVSNLGMYGIDSFTAIINPPASLIMAVGAVRYTPVVNKDMEVTVGQRMTVTVSCDHRVVDGALGAQWLQEFQRIMESPVGALL